MSENRLGLKGQPIHINIPWDSYKNVTRSLGRIANIMEFLDGPGKDLPQTKKEEYIAELNRRKDIVTALGYEVPQSIWKIRRLVKELETNG